MPKHKDCVKRNCLKCHKSFNANGKFNRLCGSCQGTNESGYDPIKGFTGEHRKQASTVNHFNDREV